MSSVAEALLGGGAGGASKRLNPLLLPPPPKLKKEPKTFIFELELEESNELSYPEYSWTELVKTKNDEDFSKKIQSGAPTLNPYASDDEDDLKAMALKFEAKYNEGPPTKKKKRRVEDYIDKGAGYDESDPFIDNSDIYDEIVPPDLQTVHGGFYINSGSLDFKEVELSEDDSDSLINSPVKKIRVKKKVAPAAGLQGSIGPTPILQKVKKAKTKIGSGIGGGLKNPVGRPPGIPGMKKRPSLTVSGGRPSMDKNGGGLLKKRKLFTPAIIGPDGKFIKSKKTGGSPFNLHPKPPKILNPPSSQDPSKSSSKVVNLTSSSEGSSSSSSEDSSSSGDSTSSEETGGAPSKDPKVPAKPPAPLQQPIKKLKPLPPPAPLPSKAPPNLHQPPPPPIHQQAQPATLPNAPQPPKRVKVKNVPLNPKLHPSTSITPVSSSSITSNPPPPPLSSKLQQQIIKDLNKLAAQQANGLHLSTSTIPSNSTPPSSTPLQKITPQKPISNLPPSSSPSNLTLASLIQQAPPSKPRKPKQSLPQTPPTSSPSIPSHLDIFTSLSSPYSSLNMSSFTTNAILKHAGLSLITSPSGPQVIPTPSTSSKAMPNLKKMSSNPSTDKLLQKTPKPKPIKKLQKLPPQNLPSPPIPSTTSSFTPVSSSPYLPSSSYKTTPPPLQGPGVEISKVPSRFSSISSSLPKSSPPPSHFPVTSSTSYLTSSLLSSTPSQSPLSVPSSLTVQRLPHSITITPSSTASYVGGTVTSTPKLPTKNSSNFDVTSLLNNPMINFASYNPKLAKPTPPPTSISNTKK